MSENSPFDEEMTSRVVAQAKKWEEASRAYPNSRAATLLADALRQPDGLDFTVQFVDGVIRPEDPHVAAENLRALAARNVKFLPAYLSVPAVVGGRAAPLAPRLAARAAQKLFSSLVGDLVLDVTPQNLGPAIARLRADGSRLNLNLLGEAVLGHEEAGRRMAATRELVARADVDYVSLKVSAVIGPHAPFGYAAAVEDAVAKMLPLYRLARDTHTFINLDMEEYKDLNLTIDVFKRILERDEFLSYRGGIVLQAYLPDARDRLRDLTVWAKRRRSRGGAPIKVRIVKGANLSMEEVDAQTHGWELAVEPAKEATDANYITIVEEALRPENIDAVNIGVAGMNLFTIAFAVLLAQDRGLTIGDGVDIEMLAGMAVPQSRAVADSVGPLLYYVPVVKPEEYDVAVAYLVRRLEENSAPANFMSSVFLLGEDAVFSREANRFASAVALARSGELSFAPNRRQDRRAGGADPAEYAAGAEFSNTPDTDPALAGNIAWAEQIAARIPHSAAGRATVKRHLLHTAGEVDDVVARVRAGAQLWARRSGHERAQALRDVADGIEARRGELIEVAGAEAGKTVDQGDIEVSEAADFARYYATLAENLDSMTGARVEPVETTLVTPPWNFPISIPAGGVLAALAAGSGVLFKPASLARRTGAVLAEIMWNAGIPQDALALVCLDRAVSAVLGERLVRVADQVILTGSIDTARMFRSWRPDLRLFAETSGKNAIIVTPHADIDLAVRDVVSSAFSHAGQKCSAASLVILMGSAGFSKRFQRQLVDAVRSLHVGYPDDLSAQMGPVVEEPHGKLLRGLTTLGPGERWVVKPQRIGENLWTPGVRVGVQPGSEFHRTEYFGPIVGIMRAKTLDEAIEWQNAVEFGLTAGLHSLDRSEINFWLESVEAGNIYVNRGITGAIVRRQPFGGWKRSSVGTGAKAGGPNYVLGLGHVRMDATGALPRQVHIANEGLRRARAIAATMTVVDQEKFLRVIRGMDHAIAAEFGLYHDPSGLQCEKNVFRYLPAHNTVIRLGRERSVGELLAVAAGALQVGAHPRISSAKAISKPMAEFFADNALDVVIEDDQDFADKLAARANDQDGIRVRLLADNGPELAAAVNGSVDVAIFDEPLTANGRIELLPFVREQAVAATNHRFGNPTSLLDGLL
ncbi:MAG: bifunctional proline dehydrogenase/L-glutamate gamma-semialdehyde dehydrogenase [Ancrocorticia sp.]|jgi:RHH-type proline utilization regulon transcriptional repressor/proline dehydrogenase/delta 1-pyrroline-5-carboxylate dehydrogenase|nr:bifunctional proline dehydrogenase/L-glutamate gamma-semialdehyde dehydrogenase [Ancrocorticia sp.]